MLDLIAKWCRPSYAWAFGSNNLTFISISTLNGELGVLNFWCCQHTHITFASSQSSFIRKLKSYGLNLHQGRSKDHLRFLKARLREKRGVVFEVECALKPRPMSFYYTDEKSTWNPAWSKQIMFFPVSKSRIFLHHLFLRVRYAWTMVLKISQL